MTSLYLPAPKQSAPSSRPSQPPPPTPTTTTTITKPKAPSYEERCNTAVHHSKLPPSDRKQHPLFVPRTLADFDDGGSFPEIHVAQYPRHIGNPHLQSKKQQQQLDITTKQPGGMLSTRGSVINVEIDETGEVSYDAIVKSGTNADKLVYTKHSDIKGTEPSQEDIALPSQDEETQTAERTRATLQALVNSKAMLDKPTGSAMLNAATSSNVESKTSFVKYTPRSDAPGYNPSASQRVIQLVPAQIDPMEPPKHQHKKAPRGPAEDPVPVLHAPPAKLSKEERSQWNVPACISNWKNTRGYTIPLDKRLAADGRGLRSNEINSKFATLSESLYVAEREAREEVRMRAEVQKRLAREEKERREQELRELANKARMERSTTTTTTTTNQQPSSEPTEVQQREALRIERKKQHERELRNENFQTKNKKPKLEDDETRDISEKIALGVHTGSGGGLAGAVDNRLYNQSSGMDSGFGAEDEYNTYTKPLFDREAAKSIYRPTKDVAVDAEEEYQKLVKGATKTFMPDKGFQGADGGGGGGGVARNAPVQFEKGN